MVAGPSTSAMPESPHPWAALHTYAERGNDAAFASLGVSGQCVHSWAEVAHRVECGAATLYRAGLRSGDMALMLMAPGTDTAEVELAVRILGATPVHRSPGLGAARAVGLLGEARVAFVLADDFADLADLESAGVPDAVELLFESTGVWESLVMAGAALLSSDPESFAGVGSASEAQGPSECCVVCQQDDVPVRLLPSAENADRDPVLMVVGDAGDPVVASARSRHLELGGELVWLRSAFDLPVGVELAAPTTVVVAAPNLAELDTLIDAGDIGDRSWCGSVARRIEFGAQPRARTRSVCVGLGLDVLVPHPVLRPADLRPRLALAPPPIDGPLPQRHSARPDAAFRLAVPR